MGKGIVTRIFLSLLLISFLQLPTAVLERTPMQNSSKLEAHRQAAIRANALAKNIHSKADARKYVDDVTQMFSDSLSPWWMQDGILERVAIAEYKTIQDPSHLI